MYTPLKVETVGLNVAIPVVTYMSDVVYASNVTFQGDVTFMGNVKVYGDSTFVVPTPKISILQFLQDLIRKLTSRRVF